MEDVGVVDGMRVCGGCWCCTRGESVEDVGVVDGMRVWRMLVLHTGVRVWRMPVLYTG